MLQKNVFMSFINYIVSTLEKLASLIEVIDPHVFVELRDCACICLTIFNGCREGEPALLTLDE